MEHTLFLRYNAELILNINDHVGDLCDDTWADIMYATDQELDNEETQEYEGTKIGFISWLYYNQALATEMGINMAQIPYLILQTNSKALLELEHDCISQETINEIGAAANPNIMVLYHFGISAAWRNKGIGEQVLKGVIKQMKGKCGYIVVLQSRPEQFEEKAGTDSFYEKQDVELAGLEKDPEKAQWKLNAFFQRCGFRLFKDYENVFVCNVDQAVVERMPVKHSAI